MAQAGVISRPPPPRNVNPILSNATATSTSSTAPTTVSSSPPPQKAAISVAPLLTQKTSLKKRKATTDIEESQEPETHPSTPTSAPAPFVANGVHSASNPPPPVVQAVALSENESKLVAFLSSMGRSGMKFTLPKKADPLVSARKKITESSNPFDTWEKLSTDEMYLFLHFVYQQIEPERRLEMFTE